MDFFLLNRKKHICESDLANLHEKGKNLLRLLNEVLPERTGTKQADGNLSGWNIWKAHVVLHQAMERMMYGYSETTSAQGAESAHKVALLHDVNFVSYCFTSFHIVSHSFTSFHIVSHRITSFHIVSHRFTSFHIVSQSE